MKGMSWAINPRSTAGLSQNVSNSCPSMCKCTSEETILCNRAGLKTNLTFLHSLWLDGNNLTFLTPGTFHALSRLQELHLSRNSRLTYLHANTFRGLLNLISLDLSHSNRITAVDCTFRQLLNLRNLYLNNNQISSISDSAFLRLNKLHFLHLSRNNLSSLPVGLFSSLPRLRYVFLSHNPWSCDCSTLWLRHGTAALIQGLDCAFPGPANATAAQQPLPGLLGDCPVPLEMATEDRCRVAGISVAPRPPALPGQLILLALACHTWGWGTLLATFSL
uniref:Uncharacterized protein n=1 Tax=Zonotrichia albicollis TaxID=44394 RepID=A0A8D2N459_ZONAL